MGKYSSVEDNISSIFGSANWTATGIKAVPTNFDGVVATNEYIRISVLSGGEQSANPLRSVSGQLIIDIFTPAGKGPTRANLIADTLDTNLVGQSISTAGGLTQFGASTMVPRGTDKANPSLSHSVYSVSFNFFGK